MLRPLPRSTPFPYTTLFRSEEAALVVRAAPADGLAARTEGGDRHFQPDPQVMVLSRHAGAEGAGVVDQPHRPAYRRPLLRSEEHTSELQSRQYLVCRLLLEK